MSVRRVGTRRVQVVAASPVDATGTGVPHRSGTRRTPGVGGTDIIPPTPVYRSGTRKVGTSPVDENATASSALPPRRATTRRAAGAKSIGQGMKEVYPNSARSTTDMDIIFVPGLGAHPEDSWRCRTTNFNWVSDKEGLARDFPRARILVYMYESTWVGNNKVKQYMDNLATTLLSAVQSSRSDFPTTRSRPIVFVGHSMGGLIIAKAICRAADSRRELFPKLFESVAGCFFFGTPFGGAPAAEFAATVAHIGEKFDQTVTSKLLELMKPDNESLYELRNDFVRCVGKLSQRIKLFAFFEEQETDLAKMIGQPIFASLFKLIMPKSLKGVMVDRDSATLSGVMDSMGMASNHRDLVKFESFKDPRYQIVRDPLKSIIHSAHLVVKNRLNSTRNIDRDMVKSLMEVLDGAHVAKKRKAISQSVVPSEWIPREAEYINWLAKPNDTSSDERYTGVRGGDCLWIYGSEGRGKTGAALAALDDIDEMILNLEKKCSGESPIILAYFFCDTTSDYCTAEDLLKSLVQQLINRQEMLATYAKQFVKKKNKDDPKTQTSMTVENLWQTLQDMLGDEDLGSRVYFVIHNLHALPDHSDSTKKLMALFQATLKYTNNQDFTRRVPIRWLLTSRQSHIIKDALLIPGTRTLDLEDDKYSNQVSLANRKHAQHKIRELAERKGYTKALAYFASSLIGRKAQNMQWIDIACVRLEELQTNNDLQVRRFLEGMPQDLKTLLDYSWSQIFTRNAECADGIREVLRVMLLTFEDPTLDALKVLAGFDGYVRDNDDGEGLGDDVDYLAALVGMCKPFLELKGKGVLENRTVGFMSLVVKKHLLENAEDLLALTAEKTRWQHGVIAHRSFSHILQTCWADNESDTQSRVEVESVEYEQGQEELEEEWAGQNSEWGGNAADGSEYYSDADPEHAFDSAHGGYDDENADPEPETYGELHEPVRPGNPHPYTVKHWLHHASKATAEVAQELSLEGEFWAPESPIRTQWLKEYTRLTSEFLRDFVNFNHASMSALHVASSIGYRQLVCALIKNGYASEITAKNAKLYTPLHFAAWFGRSHIVEVLLDNKAPVDDGIDTKDLTPLHMAACKGHVEVMGRLLKSKADPNAMCNEFGPVINGAIMSGNREAVELLVDAKAELSLESDEFESPLALATLFPDKSMFDYLVKSCSDKLPDKEYEKALIRAAEEGRADIFEQLISTIQYTPQGYEQALRMAEKESSWDIIRILLKKHGGLDYVELFTKAATGIASQDQILTDIWDSTEHKISLEVLNQCLYRATDLEKESTVELLLSFKADPNVTGHEFGNALTASAFDGTIGIIKKLVAAGADINSPHGWPLHAAAAGGHVAVVAELLTRGAEVNRVIPKGQCKTIMMHGGTALQAACEASKRDVVDLLLGHGADPNLGPPSGHTSGRPPTCPLLVASRKGEVEIFESLIKANASVDVSGGPDRTTPLINAAVSLPKSSLELLLEHGADINLTNKLGDTALIVASRKGDAELVSCLLEHGADILHANRRRENALQAAALASREECLSVLIQHMSGIMGRLRTAIEAGDNEVERVVRGFEKAPNDDIAVVDDGNRVKDIPASSEEITQDPTTEAAIIVPENDDSSKMVANMEEDLDEYNFDTLGDVDDMGIPFALPSLGLPQSFTSASAPPPVLSPSPPPMETNETAPNLTYRPPQDIRAWTPDSAPFGIQNDESSRAASPAIVVIRRKPAANGRKGTVTFSPPGVTAPFASRPQPTPSASFDQMPPASHTPPPSSLGHRSSIDENIPTAPRQLTDSPQPIQSPFNPPPPPRSSSPPKQQLPQLPTQQKEPSTHARQDSSIAQPPAYAALVAANFRSQSQPKPQSQPQLLRQSQSSTQLHQTAHSTSSSFSLRSLYSVPPASSSPMSPPLASPAPTNSSVVSSISSNTTISPVGSSAPSKQVQQQRDVYNNLQQQRQSKIDAYSSFHERLVETEPHQLQHQQSQSLASSWTMQVGNETVEQAITHMNMGPSSPDPQVQPEALPQPVAQHPRQIQPPSRSQSQPPKVSTPPISYDGEGWGDSPVAEDSPVVVDVKQHVRTAVAAIEEDPRSQGWMRTGSA